MMIRSDFAAALDWYGKGLAINQRIRPDSRATAVSLLNIGMVEGYRGRWREAAAMLEQARERFARIGVDRHPSLVGVLTQLCAVDGELERFERSAERCDQAVAMARAVHGDSHTAYLLALARRAGIAFASGRIADGDADLATARAVLERRVVHVHDVLR